MQPQQKGLRSIPIAPHDTHQVHLVHRSLMHSDMCIAAEAAVSVQVL